MGRYMCILAPGLPNVVVERTVVAGTISARENEGIFVVHLKSRRINLAPRRLWALYIILLLDSGAVHLTPM